eukprot:scaffold9517_cov117-Isochrysis_galbana.AAC.10
MGSSLPSKGNPWHSTFQPAPEQPRHTPRPGRPTSVAAPHSRRTVSASASALVPRARTAAPCKSSFCRRVLARSASAIATAPSSPMEFAPRYRLSSVSFFLHACAIATAPASRIALDRRLRVHRERLRASAAASCVAPSGPMRFPPARGCECACQTTIVPVKQRMCQSNNDCASQTTTVPVKQRLCQSTNDCASQTTTVPVKQRLCQSNNDCASQTTNVPVKQRLCQSSNSVCGNGRASGCGGARQGRCRTLIRPGGRRTGHATPRAPCPRTRTPGGRDTGAERSLAGGLNAPFRPGLGGAATLKRGGYA